MSKADREKRGYVWQIDDIMVIKFIYLQNGWIVKLVTKPEVQGSIPDRKQLPGQKMQCH